MSNQLQTLGFQIGSGAIIGGVVGFAAKKIAKILAVLVGLELALFAYLSNRGILTVKWNALMHMGSQATKAASATSPPSMLTSLFGALPVSGGFTAGVLLGWHKA